MQHDKRQALVVSPDFSFKAITKGGNKMRGERVELVCEGCGKTFSRLKSNITEGTKHHYCCRECKIEANKAQKVKRVCKQCGKHFEVYKSSLEKSNTSGNFCCRKCYDEYQKTLTGKKNRKYKRITVECPNCGKEIKTTPYKARTRKNVFCSWECKCAYHHNYTDGEKNANWKGGASRYRGDFEYVKRDHFSKIQFCALCGTTKDINIHHIIPYRMTQDNGLDNLIPLCRRHHKIVENATLPFYEMMEDKEYAKQLLNLMLRPKQRMTLYKVREIITERGAV